MDRNGHKMISKTAPAGSLSARRAWIEIFWEVIKMLLRDVALRKESVDRNGKLLHPSCTAKVALRKESVDRNGMILFIT